ncbi:MAG: HAMP domain-containing histidine kinase [Oscillibacter sp.]|nr:HAMP domain-containing histidine kinase [Oscillibacter sp.]
MIRKLRWKFVAVCMLLVTALLVTVLVAVFYSLRGNVADLSRQMLRQIIREDVGVYALPADGQRVALPYFTVNVWGESVYVTGGNYAELQDSQTLRAMVDECLEQNAREGTLTSCQMRYLRRSNGLYERIAFVDMSMELVMLRRMMTSYVIIALAALLVLLGISILLSRSVTRPAEQAWSRQRQFLSDASHELKTPLTVILSNAQMLADDAPQDAPQARRADNILAEARRMSGLVEAMLTLARADQGVRPAEMVPCRFSDLVTDCALAFEPVAFEAGKPLEEDVAPDLTVVGDPDRLRRLVTILLDNAVKYGADASPVSLTLSAAERAAKLTVSNAGEPIPPEHLAHIFERFYRADASRGESSGFGLGLSIAETIAREHKGTLRAESDEQSTRFIFTIPLKR